MKRVGGGDALVLWTGCGFSLECSCSVGQSRGQVKGPSQGTGHYNNSGPRGQGAAGSVTWHQTSLAGPAGFKVFQGWCNRATA
jgi:hypothetical protein